MSMLSFLLNGKLQVLSRFCNSNYGGEGKILIKSYSTPAASDSPEPPICTWSRKPRKVTFTPTAGGTPTTWISMGGAASALGLSAYGLRKVVDQKEVVLYLGVPGSVSVGRRRPLLTRIDGKLVSRSRKSVSLITPVSRNKKN